MATTTLISRPNPYVGPRPYRQGEIIYGRERETSELLDLLIAERIVLLYSPSGAGKSSLLNAAIFPKMVEQGFDVLPPMRVNLEPPPDAENDPAFNRYIYSCLLSMEEALPEDKRFSVNDLATLRFKDYIARYRERALSLNPEYSDPSLLLMFDQAEEVTRISLTDREKKVEFFAQVGEVLRDRNIWALFSIREDYLASFDSYVRPIPTRLANRYRLNFLSAEAAMQAIQRPAAKAGVEFPDDCASSLTDDLRKILVQQPDGSAVEELGPFVEPVQLQVVCRRLWSELPDGVTAVTSEHIEALGSVNRALADYYALQVASVAATSHFPEREIREWFDRKLITVSGMRGQVLMTPGQSDGLDNKAIWLLERTYLIRAEKRGGATWFELAHDRLVRPLRENNGDWFEKNLSALQRQADVWNTQGRPDGMLIIGQDFLEMQKWAEANRATMIQVEKDFYAESQKAYEADKRERRNNTIIRWLFVASLVALVVAIVGVIFALYQRRVATVREHVAAANEVVAQDPQLAALIALKAIEEAKTTPADLQLKAQEALHHALMGMRVERVFSGHTGRVDQAFFDTEGRRFITVSRDNKAIIWAYGTGQPLLTLSKPGLQIRSAAFSVDGKQALTGSVDGKISVWDATNGKLLTEFAAHADTVNWLDFNSDGSLLASAGADGKVSLWDAKTFANLRTIPVDPQGLPINVSAVRFSPDGKKLASGDWDGFARLWDVQTGEKLDEVKHNPDDSSVRVLGLAFSPDGKRLVTTGSDFDIVESSAVNGAFISRLEGHYDWVWTVAFTHEPDVKKQRLISVSSDRTVRVWDVNTGKPLMVISGFVDQLFTVDLHADEQHILVASADKYVYDIDISPQGSRDSLALTAIPAGADTIDYSPDGAHLAVAGDASLRFFDTKTGELASVTEPQAEKLISMDFSPDGKSIVATGETSKVYVFDVATGKARATFSDYKTPDTRARWATFAPDNQRVAVAGSDGIVYVFDANTGQTIFSVSGSDTDKFNDVTTSAAAFTPNGKYLAIGVDENITDNDRDNNRYYIHILDAATGKSVHTIEDSEVVTEYIWKIAISPDSELLSVGFDESTGIVPLWNIAPGQSQWSKLKNLKGSKGIVYSLDFSPDGKQLLTGSADKTMLVWDVKTGTIGMILYGATQMVNSVRFSPTGLQVASVSDVPAVIRLYELDPDALVKLAHQRLTRWWRDAEECNQYLQSACPPRPADVIGQ